MEMDRWTWTSFPKTKNFSNFWNRTYNTKYETPIFYHSWCFSYWIRRCPLPVKWSEKMKVISYNSRILSPQEQKLSTLDRELLGIVHALQIYELLIIGSPYIGSHPIHISPITNLYYIVLQKKITLASFL